MVTGFAALPNDPFDSASGPVPPARDGYAVTFGLNADESTTTPCTSTSATCLSGGVTGSPTGVLVRNPNRREVFGSFQDASYIYPIVSPLVGGANAVFDHVAANSGQHYVAVQRGPGNYNLRLEVYRSGPG